MSKIPNSLDVQGAWEVSYHYKYELKKDSYICAESETPYEKVAYFVQNDSSYYSRFISQNYSCFERELVFGTLEEMKKEFPEHMYGSRYKKRM